ncbi:DMT family transporter [Paenibacillus sp. PL2-23]|uniref:DMT family transporter n=1 Tax=Paenibacillus sp. PL2-23 TaxID=2100729 RepID=UPI0030F50DF6
MNKQWLGFIMVLISAAGFGLMGIFAKFAYTYQVSIGTLLLARFAIAGLCLWGWIWLRGIPFAVSRKQLAVLALMGAGGYTLMAKLLFTSYALLPVSLAGTLFFIYPVLVCTVSHLLRYEKLTLRRIIPITVSLYGVYLVLGASLQRWSTMGVVCALSSAFVYALYIVITEKGLAHIAPLVSSAYIVSFAALGLFAMGLFNQDLSFSFVWQGWLPIMTVALFSTVLAIWSFSLGVKWLGSTKAALFSTIEPIIPVLLGMVLFGEALTSSQVWGSLLIIMATTVIFSRKREDYRYDHKYRTSDV